MINENRLPDFGLSYNLIEYEKCCSLTIKFNGRNGLDPFIKLIHNHNNVMMPPNRSWVAINEVHPPLGEGIDNND